MALQCECKTAKPPIRQCTRNAISGTRFCWQHQGCVKSISKDVPRPVNKVKDVPRPVNKVKDVPRPVNKVKDVPRPVNKVIKIAPPLNADKLSASEVSDLRRFLSSLHHRLEMNHPEVTEQFMKDMQLVVCSQSAATTATWLGLLMVKYRTRIRIDDIEAFLQSLGDKVLGEEDCKTVTHDLAKKDKTEASAIEKALVAAVATYAPTTKCKGDATMFGPFLNEIALIHKTKVCIFPRALDLVLDGPLFKKCTKVIEASLAGYPKTEGWYEIGQKLETCKHRLLVVSLGLYFEEEKDDGHANILLYDTVQKTVERFEPNGETGSDECVDKFLKSHLPKGYKFLPSSEVCIRAPQKYDPAGLCDDKSAGGYCVIFSMAFAYARILFPDITPDRVVDAMTNIMIKNPTWIQSFQTFVEKSVQHYRERSFNDHPKSRTVKRRKYRGSRR